MLKVYPSETETYTDSDTGATITRLTGWFCNSNHIYFTNNSFYDNGKRLIINSERENRHNLFSVELETGIITQITDLPALEYGNHHSLLTACVDAATGNCCFVAERKLYIVNAFTTEMREIYAVPDGFATHNTSISADGKYVYTSIYERASQSVHAVAGKSSGILNAISQSKPLSKIVRVAVDGSGYEYIFEEHEFIAHVNASPTAPTLLTFCHEGNWNKVDHRLWLMNTETCEVKKLHPCKPGENIGHEYWFADGQHIGYHGRIADVGCQLGCVKADESEDISQSFNFNTGHIFSFDRSLIVGDGGTTGKYIRVWKLGENGYEQPRALCYHASSFKTQQSHVHPRITPNGKGILYTSDLTGYNQVYIAHLPENIDTLPLLETLSKY